MTLRRITLIPGLCLGAVAITGAGLALGNGHHRLAAPAPHLAAHTSTASHVAGPTPQPRAAATEPASRASAPQTFHSWWVDSGRSQYARVASRLWKVIMGDVVNDRDATFSADLRDLAAAARAGLANPPPVGTTEYMAAMRDFQHGSETGLRGSYARAYGLIRAGLGKMRAFNSTAGLKVPAR